MENKIYFELPEDSSFIEIIDKISASHGLTETPEEYFKKIGQDKEPILHILLNAVEVILHQKVPEEKLLELLQNHLNTTKEVAEKIIEEIKEKIIPYAKKIPEPPRELKNTFKPIPSPALKEPTILNVEKNAQELKMKRDIEIKKETNKEATTIQNHSDQYREPIE